MRVINDAIISEPGDIHPQRIAIAAPQLSWEINAPGSFSGFVRLDELRRAGLAGDLRGMWLTYLSSAGEWGGVVTGRPLADGVAEITGEGFVSLLRGQILNDAVLAMSGSAGGLAKRAIRASGRDGPAFLRFGTIDEGGGPVSMALSGDVGNDLLPQLADAGDVEWIVDADRVFTLSRRLGHDRSASVRLVEDRHIIEARVADDLLGGNQGQTFHVQSELSQGLAAFRRAQASPVALQPPTNPAVPLSPTPAMPAWWERVTKITTITFAADVWESLPEGIPSGGSVPTLARRHAERVAWQTYAIDPPGVIAIPSVSSAPPPWVGKLPGVGANNPSVPAKRGVSAPTIPVELTLANIDDCFSLFDLGDTVRIDLGSVGVSGRFRMKSKALDVAGNVLTVAGDLLKDA
jgi:hypothetical protein